MIGYAMKTNTNIYYLKLINNMEPDLSYERFSSIVMLLVKCIGSWNVLRPAQGHLIWYIWVEHSHLWPRPTEVGRTWWTCWTPKAESSSKISHWPTTSTSPGNQPSAVTAQAELEENQSGETLLRCVLLDVDRLHTLVWSRNSSHPLCSPELPVAIIFSGSLAWVGRFGIPVMGNIWTD